MAGRANDHPSSHFGFWFGTDPAVVGMFYADGSGASVIPAYLSVSNPLKVLASEAVGWSTWTNERAKAFRKKLIGDGRDGVIVLPATPPFGEYTSPYIAVFSPHQVRSVFAPDKPFCHPALTPKRANLEASRQASAEPILPPSGP